VKKRFTSAFSLVELTAAIGIAAFCLIGVFGLIPIGVQANRNATSQTRATNILSSVVSDLRATGVPRPTPSPTPSVLYCITLPASGTFNTAVQTRYFDSEGQCSCDSAGSQRPNWLSGDCSNTWSPPLQVRYRLSVTFPSASSGLTYADLKVTWPAPIDPATTTPSGSVEIFAALDRK
jgi:uncharacterized protein (TIGR02598 family)